MDQRTRKLMTMYMALHPRDDVNRLYVSRKEWGGRLASTEDSVDASIQQVEDYIEKHGGGLITAIMTKNKKQKWKEKQLYDRFKRLTNNITHEKI